MKNKKILSIIFFAGVAAFFGYYFMPKSKHACGSTVPMQCQICTCAIGFPVVSRAIGSNEISCYGGPMAKCQATKN
jgi:hypothetical protein